MAQQSSSQFFNNAIFWIEVDKIKPNPYQPRNEFDVSRLRDLAESIRMYGVLQPLTVTRNEVLKEDGGLAVEYELIAGERRWRASKLAGLTQVPAIIRSSQEDSRVKLELAIIENLQREDLNPVDRARAFQRLADEFKFKHIQIAEKVGKSREYVSNSLRLLMLSTEILDAISSGKISEGHARPLMMLNDRPEEQGVLFKEITFKKLTVRETEVIARKIAFDKVRKKERAFDPEIVELEEKLQETLGTRVHIERKDNGGKLMIDFFSNEDLRGILDLIKSNTGLKRDPNELMNKFISNATPLNVAKVSTDTASAVVDQADPLEPIVDATSETALDDRSSEEKNQEDNSEGLYSVKNFSI
ncbi:MAG: ParB/RepB/Spo0J family partition protein [Candidatus Pacebacteria bacterium]|nr:ParB/RepB/Spo0J family partition protein [Candidatus Paceibacterota bacterium]